MSEKNPETIWNDERITGYVLDELPIDEREAFERELQSNTALAAAVEEARNVTGKLENLFSTEASVTLDAERRESIQAAVAQTNVAGTSLAEESSGWFRSHFLQIAIAASLVFVAGWLALPPLQMARKVAVNDVGEARRPQEKEVMHVESEAIERAVRDGNMPRFGVNVNEFADEKSPDAQLAQSQLDREERLSESDADVAAEAISDEDAKNDRPQVARVAKSSRENKKADVSTRESAPQRALERGGAGYSQQAAAPAPAIAPASASAPADAPAASEPAPVSGNFRSERQMAEAAPLGVVGKDIARGRLSDRADNLGRRRGSALHGLDELTESDDGLGPGQGGDKFDTIDENPFKRVAEHPLSTFSVDVDTASYSKVRDLLMRANQLPRRDAVRIEEMLNYFDYDYEAPSDSSEHPFAARAEITSCPWNAEHRLARVSLKGKAISQGERPPCNLVFLIDTSGSMNQPNKLPLVIEGMKMLQKQLTNQDRVAIAVYAGSAGLVLDSTKATKKKKILRALTELSAGGSTNGGAGIALAYQTARDNFIANGVNRVILCSDGDFNVGTTGTDELVQMVEREAKGGVFLTVLGFGMGNHNDAMLEQISGRGNGNYAFIDTQREARKVLVEQTSGTLVTIAKDVKLQVEFNPARVAQYRLIGYENRVLAKEDFNDDKKDAGEIGAGHSVTALYEIVPAGMEADASRPEVDALKYQQKSRLSEAADSDETLTLKLRYKQPDGDTSTLVEFPVRDGGNAFDEASDDFRFAASVANFGMQLRRSQFKGNWTMADVIRIATKAKGADSGKLREEFVQLAKKASELMGGE